MSFPSPRRPAAERREDPRFGPDGSPYPKASLWLRGGARLFDTAVAFGLYTVTSAAGPLVTLLFILFADGLFEGQSVGKRVFGLRVVHLPTRAPAEYRESVLRNAPFALVILLGLMPSPLGYVAFLAGALVIGGVEGWKVFRDALGIRSGDVWGQTQVVDGKVVMGARTVEDTARSPGRVFNSARPRRAVRWRREQRCGSR